MVRQLLIFIFILLLISCFYFLYINTYSNEPERQECNIDNLNYFDEHNNHSLETIDTNMKKMKCINEIIIEDIEDEITKKLNEWKIIINNSKPIVEENETKTNILKKINCNLDLVIAMKEQRKKELIDTNNDMSLALEKSNEKIQTMLKLNKKLSVAIDNSNIEIDRILAKCKEMSDFNNICEKKIKIDGDKVIDGTGKDINMEDTIYLKMNVDHEGMYYTPIFKLNHSIY